MYLFGTYRGVVESIDDPEQRNRVKARVPLVYGPANGAVSTADLPWAMPAGLPAGGSADSGGFDWPAVVGDQVWVRFLDGEPEKPIWEWALQDKPQATNYPFRHYNGSTPDRHVLITRYGMSLEISEAGIIETTAQGYSMTWQEASAPGAQDGALRWLTNKGYYVYLEDAPSSMFIFVPYLHADYTDLLFHGRTSTFTNHQTFTVDSEIVEFNALLITCGQDARNDGGNALIRRTDLQNVVDQIIAWADSHGHPGDGSTNEPLQVRVTSSNYTFSL